MSDTSLLPPRYKDPEKIARGGMGIIYRAEDAVLGRTVAIKVLAEPYADDESIRRRFTREALAAARLSNAPSTTTIFDVGEHDGRPYIVMEYLRGGSLADRIAAGGAQPPGRALEWLGQAAAALDAAHAAGIVHRDVKPANLLLDDTDCVHVADFGVASAAGMDSFTAAGTVLGTAGYLAPEQARGERAGPPSDRYALAVVAYELLTGARPFARDSAAAEAAAHVTDPPPSPSTVDPSLPHELDAVFSRALAKEPQSRYPSCADFVGALREALDAAAGHTMIRSAERTTTVAAPRRNRMPLALGLVAALALALVGAAIAFSLAGDGDGETTPPVSTNRPQPTTVQETVTLEGTTIVETVTTQVEPEPEPEPEPPATTEAPPTTAADPPPSSGASASELNDEGFALMQAGDYASALPLLEQAVAQRTGDLTEAYASYNLAFTRRALGQCGGILALLARSEAIQGARSEITRLRAETEQAC